MELHYQTFLLVAGVFQLINAASLGVAYYAAGRFVGINYIGVGIALAAFGTLVASLDNIVPESLVILGTDSLLFAGSVMIYVGFVQLNHQPVQTRWAWGLAAAAMLLIAWFTFASPNPLARVVIYSSTIGFLAFAAAWIQLRSRLWNDWPAKAAGIAMLVIGGLSVIRVVSVVLFQPNAPLLPTALQGAIGLSVFVALYGLSFSLIGLLLRKLYRDLERRASTDPLTGILNRNAMQQAITQNFNQCKEKTVDFAVLLADVDYFKRINDTYGHSVGDKVLVRLTELFAAKLRSTDIICRWGGEEFLLLLPRTDYKTALSVAERLRQAVEADATQLGTQEVRCTISIGVVACASQYTNVENLLNQVDEALYTAKSQGRNRVVGLA